ncbi:hypothetical protein [Thermococcus sp.]
MSPIKVKTLTRQIIALADGLGFSAVPEYRTPDGTRVDIAVLNGERKLLAIELEASFKWFPQRVLYDVVKAHRAGFSELWVVVPFRANPGWVLKYAEELGLTLVIMGEEEAIERLKTSLPSGT